MKRVKIQLNRPQPLQQIAAASTSPFSTFSTIVDPTGNLNFDGKASLGSEGIKFENGTTYQIKLDDFQLLQMLGRGQFGIVQKVVHKPTQVIMGM
jgi:mitogen-activated protein kinase kinase